MQLARRVPLAVFWLLAAAILVGQQPLQPDELRSKSSVYFPPPPIPTIRARVDLVEVPVTVRDGNRRTIAGLTQSAFEVFDAGKKRAITSFSVETFDQSAKPAPPQPPGEKRQVAPVPVAPASRAISPPRLIALLFDDLNLSDFDVVRAKAAAGKFVKESLAPGDRVAVVTTASPAATTFISEVPEIVKRIDAVIAHPRYSDDDPALSCPQITAYQAYLLMNCLDPDLLAAKVAELAACRGDPAPMPVRVNCNSTAAAPVMRLARPIWDRARSNSENTVRAVSDLVDAMAKPPGRRMILITSAGFLSGELEEKEEDLTLKALHAGVVINTLEARGLYAYVPGGDASQQRPASSGRGRQRAQIVELQIQAREMDAPDDALSTLAYGTGGTFYHNNNDLAAGFRELGAVPDVVYVLGFSMSDTEPDGKYHPLRVRLTGGHHGAVQSRVGYMAPLKDAPPATAPQRAIDREVLAGDTINDLPVSFSLNARKPGVNVLSQEPALAAIAHVDLSRLNLGMRADRRTQKLTFIAALVDASGVFVAGKEGKLDVALRESTYRQLAPTGFNMSLTLDAPPGQYTLREVIAEELTGKMTAVNQAVVIR